MSGRAECVPDTDGGVVGGGDGAVVLVAVLMLVHDTAASPSTTIVAKVSRLILSWIHPKPSPGSRPPSPTNSDADIRHAPAPATIDDKPLGNHEGHDLRLKY